MLFDAFEHVHRFLSPSSIKIRKPVSMPDFDQGRIQPPEKTAVAIPIDENSPVRQSTPLMGILKRQRVQDSEDEPACSVPPSKRVRWDPGANQVFTFDSICYDVSSDDDDSDAPPPPSIPMLRYLAWRRRRGEMANSHSDKDGDSAGHRSAASAQTRPFKSLSKSFLPSFPISLRHGQRSPTPAMAFDESEISSVDSNGYDPDLDFDPPTPPSSPPLSRSKSSVMSASNSQTHEQQSSDAADSVHSPSMEDRQDANMIQVSANQTGFHSQESPVKTPAPPTTRLPQPKPSPRTDAMILELRAANHSWQAISAQITAHRAAAGLGQMGVSTVCSRWIRLVNPPAHPGPGGCGSPGSLDEETAASAADDDEDRVIFAHEDDESLAAHVSREVGSFWNRVAERMNAERDFSLRGMVTADDCRERYRERYRERDRERDREEIAGRLCVPLR